MHRDLVRKEKVVFGNRRKKVRGFLKFVQRTARMLRLGWISVLYFPCHLKKRGNLLEAFLGESLKRKPERNLVRMLRNAKLLFWRGKRAEPMYKPPRSLGYPEGNVEVDITILAEKAIIFVEAKYHSKIAIHTTHCPNKIR